MELGQRIKAARLEAGLSQRQLCGQVITRNMLSLIENGAARPSMDTLAYLAQQTGKPISWFLEEETVTSPNRAAMAQARTAWEAGEAEGVLAALESYRAPDETFDSEAGLLRYLALMHLADRAVTEGRLPYACQLLEQAEKCQSPYILREHSEQLLRAGAGLPARLDCDGVLLQQARQALAAQQPQQAQTFLQAAVDHDEPRWQLLMGQARFACGDYAGAVRCLEMVETLYPRDTLPQLEVCHRELGDFRRAYEYACKQR